MLITSLGHPATLHKILHGLSLQIVHQSVDLVRLYSDECHPTSRELDVHDLPPYIILLRHGESAGLEELQEELQIPNHRVPLSAKGVAQALHAGQLVQQLLQEADVIQQTKQPQLSPVQLQGAGATKAKVFLYTSPFLRCIQTAQHAVRGLDDNRLVGFQEEVQLREQDWGNFQEPGQQAKNYADRIKYGRFFYRFPDGESAADVYDRMTMFQDHFIRDIAYKRFSSNTSVMLVTHGLALRLFLMRWLHWSVDDFLQVHNPPTAAPIILHRQCPSLGCGRDQSGDAGSPRVSPETIKACYQLTPESLRHVRGVSDDMSCCRSLSSKQQLLDWRPYRKQVPPPPAMDPGKEALLHQLMEVGYTGKQPA